MSSFTPKEKLNTVMLYCLYFQQGVVISFPFATFPVLLVEAQFDFKQIGLLTFCATFFTLKVFWAPCMDSYYFKSFGKRKSYIVPILYLITIINLYYSSRLGDMIQNHNFPPILIFAYLTIFLQAVCDVAIDGWVLTLYEEANQSYGSVVQAVGTLFGWFLSQYVFILLNSKKFCYEYLGQPIDEPLITIQGYLLFIFGFNLILVIYIHFFQKEINPTTKEFESVFEVFKLFKKFWTHIQLRYVLLIFFFYRFGFATIDVGYLKLLKLGFPKETWTEIGIFVFPISIAVSLLYGKYSSGKSIDLQAFLIGCFIKWIAGILFTICIEFYDKEDNYLQFITLIISLASFTIVNQIWMVTISAFIFKIGDVNIGGTFVTTLGGISNIGRVVGEPLSVYFLGKMDYITISVFGIIYSFIFMMVSKKRIQILDNLSKQEYQISQEEERNYELPLIEK